MPTPLFQPGNKAAKGGKREGAGRKSAKELRALLKAVNKAEARLVDSVSLIEGRYVLNAVDGKHERTTIHAMENYVKPVTHDIQPTAIIHQFIQFGASDPNTVQLSAEELSSPVLGGDDTAAQEAGGNDMASAERQGQNGIEFRSFANVPGKRG
ncbi:MAG: hypothetical protein V4563_15800 [Pseudomonadota bacterium]